MVLLQQPVTVSGRGVVRRGDGVPHYFRQGARVPHSPIFWTEIGAKVSPLFQLVSY